MTAAGAGLPWRSPGKAAVRRGWVVGLVGLATLAVAADAAGETSRFAWRHHAFAPCEGMGGAFDGAVEMVIEHRLSDPGRTISSLKLATHYQQPHQLMGSLAWNTPDGGRPMIDLAPVGGSGEPGAERQNLVLRNAAELHVAAGSPLVVTLRVRFPQNGGACRATIERAVTIP